MLTAHHRANTKIGQNFLIDRNILEFILQHADISPEDTILEVGAGKGILTRGILERCPRLLYTLEIDRSLEPFMTVISRDFENLRIFWGDALKGGFPETFDPVPNKMISNIPYHITTPLIWKVLESLAARGLDYLLLMVQKETAERICAPSCCKARCPLGITIQSMGNARILRSVPPEAFQPAPSVTSALLEIGIRRNHDLPNSEIWRRLIRSGFSQRRKTLANNLGRDFPMEKEDIIRIISDLGQPRSVRAEELEIDQWHNLCNSLSQVIDGQTAIGRQR